MTTTVKKPFAAFDIDGTLVKGSIGVDFVNWLYARGTFPDSAIQAINEADALHSSGQISYVQRGKLIITNWARGFADMPVDLLRDLCDEHNRTYTNIFEGAIELVSTFRNHGYHVMAFTRPFESIVTSLDALHGFGFDEVYGTKLEVLDGHYTGNLLNEMWSLPAKGKLLKSAIHKHSLSTHNSFAFGDTAQDVAMLELAEHPVALHPTEDLRAIAQDRAWLCFDSIPDALSWIPEHL